MRLKKFVLTMFLCLTTVFTCSLGYAIVFNNVEKEERYSRPYQIVKSGLWILNDRRYENPYIVEAGETISLSQQEYDKIYVNGELTTAEELVCQSGEKYIITQVKYQEDEDFIIFDID